MNPYKKNEEAEQLNSLSQDAIENTSQNEKSPEFDVIGTALNDI